RTAGDGFDEKGRSGMLDTLPFYLNCRERLTAEGMMAVNLLTRRKGVAASAERLRKAFDDRVRVLPPPEAGNTVALAAAGTPVCESFADRRAAPVAIRSHRASRGRSAPRRVLLAVAEGLSQPRWPRGVGGPRPLDRGGLLLVAAGPHDRPRPHVARIGVRAFEHVP